METGFMKADSANLPRIDSLMVGLFFKSSPDFCSAEFRNVKTSVSARQSYGDDAIGYVQLRREMGLCIVKCKICPEHKVRSKSYSVSMIVNEKEEMVDSVQCHDCAASQGGCKHAVAFLMWVHRRSEEPPCTSVECYWKKSKLSKVGSTLKFVTAKSLSKNYPSAIPTPDFYVLSEFLKEGKKRKLQSLQMLKHQQDFCTEDVKMLSLHHLINKFREECKDDGNKFIHCLPNVCAEAVLKKIEVKTREQYKNCLWHELRYGRITASKAFDVSRCKTEDGSLVTTVMGARTLDTKAMKRGRDLEAAVRCTVEEMLGGRIKKCGILISKKCPIIAASPDGISHDAIIEIKCPTSEKTNKNYIRDGKITQKYSAQVQIQMFVSNFKKCYFCVADSKFEMNKKVEVLLVEYNEDYVNNILNDVIPFWINNVYPLLCKSIMV